MTSRIYLTTGLLLALVTMPAESQPAGDSLSSLVPEDTETVGDFSLRLKSAAQTDLETAMSDVTAAAAESIAAQPSTPDGFATRVHNSLANFLPFFEFGVDAVTTSEDQESVVVSFNPLSAGGGAINFKATVVEPEPYEPLLSAIIESSTQAQEAALKEQLDDFSDIELTATYGYQRGSGGKTWATSGRTFGRNAKLYEDLIGELMYYVWDSAFPADTSVALALADYGDTILDSPGVDPNANVEGLTFEVINRALTAEEKEEYLELLRQDARIVRDMNNVINAANLDQLAALIDNQPQATLTASYRNRDDRVGPGVWSFTARYERGSRNVNRVRKQYRKDMASWEAKRTAGLPVGDKPTPLSSYQTTVGENDENLKKNKFVFSLNYRNRELYAVTHDYEESVTDPDTGVVSAIPRSAMVESASRDEWCGKVQYSRAVRGQKVNVDGKEVYPRFDLSVEYVDVQGDPDRNNRFVATASYLLPLPAGMSLPLTLTYSDKSEFLGEPDHQFNAHLGLSYKLSNLFGGGN